MADPEAAGRGSGAAGRHLPLTTSSPSAPRQAWGPQGPPECPTPSPVLGGPRLALRAWRLLVAAPEPKTDVLHLHGGDGGVRPMSLRLELSQGSVRPVPAEHDTGWHDGPSWDATWPGVSAETGLCTLPPPGPRCLVRSPCWTEDTE